MTRARDESVEIGTALVLLVLAIAVLIPWTLLRAWLFPPKPRPYPPPTVEDNTLAYTLMLLGYVALLMVVIPWAFS